MVLKPIDSGLTLKAAFPTTALSGPRLVAKSSPSHNPTKAPGKPQDGPLRPCQRRYAAQSNSIENRVNPISAIHNAKQNHKPMPLRSNHQSIKSTMAGFHFKYHGQNFCHPKIINRDASLLLISDCRPDQINK